MRMPKLSGWSERGCSAAADKIYLTEGEADLDKVKQMATNCSDYCSKHFLTFFVSLLSGHIMLASCTIESFPSEKGLLCFMSLDDNM